MPLPFPLKLAALLAASTLALAGCSHDEATPSPEASYSRAVTYLDQASPARHDTAYQSPALQIKAELSPKSCAIYLQPATNKESLVLSIPRAQMSAGLIGSYAFRGPVNPSAAPSYGYRVNTSDDPSGSKTWSYENWWLPSTGAVAGAVDLTAYDAKRHLLSGHFRLALTGTYDPRASSNEFSTRRCDLTLTGTFANVPVADIK